MADKETMSQNVRSQMEALDRQSEDSLHDMRDNLRREVDATTRSDGPLYTRRHLAADYIHTAIWRPTLYTPPSVFCLWCVPHLSRPAFTLPQLYPLSFFIVVVVVVFAACLFGLFVGFFLMGMFDRKGVVVYFLMKVSEVFWLFFSFSVVIAFVIIFPLFILFLLNLIISFLLFIYAIVLVLSLPRSHPPASFLLPSLINCLFLLFFSYSHHRRRRSCIRCRQCCRRHPVLSYSLSSFHLYLSPATLFLFSLSLFLVLSIFWSPYLLCIMSTVHAQFQAK